MAGAITVTSMTTYENQSGDLSLADPSTTDRPEGFWSVPSWHRGRESSTFYESCARVDNSANNDIIYIASSTRFPRLKIEWDGTSYTFDGDQSREHVNRILITNSTDFPSGSDYRCPLRRKAITAV